MLRMLTVALLTAVLFACTPADSDLDDDTSPDVEDNDTGEGTSGTLPGVSTADFQADVAPLIDDLWWTSESDYLWDVVVLEGAADTLVTAESIKGLVNDVHPHDEDYTDWAELAVEEADWADLFDKGPPEDWWEQSQHDEADRYELLFDYYVENQEDAVTFRIGEDEGGYVGGVVHIYILGTTTDGDIVGIHTISIET